MAPSTPNTLGSQFVTIHVGPVGRSEEFAIHKKLFCEKVDFFNKAFTGGFKENEGMMKLPDEKPEIFRLFIDWLYRSEVAIVKDNKQYTYLCELYIFAEKICHKDLANNTMDSIRVSFYEYGSVISISLELAAFVYQHTEVGSKLRLYCVHEIAFRLWDGKESTWPSPIQLLYIHKAWRDHEDLFCDYFSYMRENPIEQMSPWQDMEFMSQDPEETCTYHSHEAGEAWKLSPDWARQRGRDENLAKFLS
ncbi:uncharacterized protein RSE6_02848 [Rhynchosporium secalis]|uniref:BTB domain-containing protein n=1 Tax=Rhynchosporium secalis TaxID=38038 RepID=A0A1E1M1A4_RHYSE|nr:uncharacterized protein RSE6_02848 [Rhynchosporium secalis]